jgi:hypothetical protein
MRTCDRCKGDFEDTIFECPNCNWELREKEIVEIINTDKLPEYKRHLSSRLVLFVFVLIFLTIICLFIGDYYYGLKGREMRFIWIVFGVLAVLFEKIFFKNSPYKKRQLTKK